MLLILAKSAAGANKTFMVIITDSSGPTMERDRRGHHSQLGR